MKNIYALLSAVISIGSLLSPSCAKAQATVSPLKYGKYGCTSSKYTGGYYQYTPHGSFVLNKDGTYTYLGFKKPSTGSFTADAKGNLLFKGGYLDGGLATKIDRPNKFFLVFPSIPDNRWTCGCVDK